MDFTPFTRGILSTIVYSVIGIVMFFIVWQGMVRLSPFSVRKEIEEDQNIALGIVMGSVMIGLAIIIAAAVHG